MPYIPWSEYLAWRDQGRRIAARERRDIVFPQLRRITMDQYPNGGRHVNTEVIPIDEIIKDD